VHQAKVWRLYAAAALFVACHLTIEFVAWSYAIRYPFVWKIISFPAFAIASAEFSTSYFWILFVANSAAWSALFVVIFKWRTRRSISRRAASSQPGDM
jgi:hypothetical protein